MNCPFCLEEVKPEALVCRTCHRDLLVPKPLMEENQRLKDRVASLETELAEAKRALPRERAAKPAPVAKPPMKPVPAILLYVVLPLVVLLVAHYVLIVHYDVKLIWLRIASILFPAIFGFLMEERMRPSVPLLIGTSLFVALCSVFGMSLVVNLIDGDPILPKGAVVWRETLEYVASIALSYALGSLICRGLRPVRVHAANAKGLITTIAVAMAKAKGETPGSPKTLEQRIERSVKLMNLAISGATAAGAIYTGLKAALL
jgi:hypothetical protein